MNAGKMPDEAELQALYRDASAAADDGPGGEIDARILGVARAAAAEVQARHRPPSPAWWQRWLVPVSVSAVAVLGVSLTLRVNDEQAALEAARMGGEAPVLNRPDAARGAPVAEGQQSADRTLAKESSGVADNAAQVEAKTQASGSANRPAANPAPAPTPGTGPLDARAKRAPAPFPAAENALPSSPSPQSSGELAPSPRPTSSSEKQTSKRERADTAERAPSAPALALPPAAVLAPQLGDRAGNAAKAAASKLGESSERRTRAAEADQEAGADLSARGALSKSRPAATARQEAETAAIEASPERWLEQIRNLRRAGRFDEARLQLDRFRQRYPDGPLPDDLK